MGNWIEKKLYDLTPENLELLILNKIPAIRIRDFVSKEDSAKVAERLIALSFHNYDHLNDIPVNHVGVCHNQWVKEDKGEYFKRIPAAQKEIDAAFHGIIENPVHKVIETLNRHSGRHAQIFEEDGYGPYFAGAFRSFKGHGRLHVDHAPTHIQSDWAVTRISKQMTWNIYFTVPQSGGDLVIYDYVHNDENEKLKVPGEYYFPYSVVEGHDSIRIKPEIGELIIFNTQNFHEIFGIPTERRISLTSFMGIKPDGTLNLWS